MEYIIRYISFTSEVEIERVLSLTSLYLPEGAREVIMTTAEKLRAEGRVEGIEQGRAEGIEKGRAEGIKKGKIETASAMLARGYPLADVIEITGLSEQQLRQAGLLK